MLTIADTSHIVSSTYGEPDEYVGIKGPSRPSRYHSDQTTPSFHLAVSSTIATTISTASGRSPMDSARVESNANPTQDVGTSHQSKRVKDLQLPSSARSRFRHLPIPTPIAATALHWRLDSDGRLVQGERPTWPDTSTPWDEPDLPLRPKTGIAEPLLPDPDTKESSEARDVQNQSQPHRKTISKSDISSPTLISSSFSRALVDLPAGASLKNGMEPYRSLGYRQTPELLFQRSPGFNRNGGWPLAISAKEDTDSQALANDMRKESRFTGFSNWSSQPSVTGDDGQSSSDDMTFSNTPAGRVRSEKSFRQLLFGENEKAKVQRKRTLSNSVDEGHNVRSSAIRQSSYDAGALQSKWSSTRSMRYVYKGRCWLRKVQKPKACADQ